MKKISEAGVNKDLELPETYVGYKAELELTAADMAYLTSQSTGVILKLIKSLKYNLASTSLSSRELDQIVYRSGGVDALNGLYKILVKIEESKIKKVQNTKNKETESEQI